MQPTTRTHANRQPFRSAPTDIKHSLKPTIENALDNDVASVGVRIECRTDNETAFSMELHTHHPGDGRYAWRLSQEVPSPAPSTYYVLDRGWKYVLVEAKGETTTELVQEANYLLHSIGGPTADLGDVYQLQDVREPQSLINRVLEGVLRR